MNWDLIFRKHSPGILNYLINLTGNRQEAEDLLQETFIKAMRCEDSLRESDKIHSWLLTISRNLFLDAKKKDDRRKTKPVADLSQIENNMTIDHQTPEEITQRRDFMGFLHKALADLSESYRTAFTLGVIQRLSYREIEEITGWSLSMVKINVFRARKKVAFELQEFQG